MFCILCVNLFFDLGERAKTLSNISMRGLLSAEVLAKEV